MQARNAITQSRGRAHTAPALYHARRRQIPQQRTARQEEVAAAERAHELRHALEPHRRLARRQAEPIVGRIRTGMTRADDRIALVHQAVERRRLQPRLLDELELPLEVRVQAHEEEARTRAVARLVAAADAQDAMAVRDREL